MCISVKAKGQNRTPIAPSCPVDWVRWDCLSGDYGRVLPRRREVQLCMGSLNVFKICLELMEQSPPLLRSRLGPLRRVVLNCVHSRGQVSNCKFVLGYGLPEFLQLFRG